MGREYGCTICITFVGALLVGSGTSNLCGGRTGLKTKWVLSEYFHSVSVDIDPEHCQFRKKKFSRSQDDSPITTQFVTTVYNTATDSQMTDVSQSVRQALVLQGKVQVVVTHRYLRGLQLLAQARRYWQVSWIGEQGRNSGSTVQGHSGWKTGVDGRIFIDIDTSQNGKV